MNAGPERLIGHDAAERALIDGARSGRLHHAWLLTGPAGIGKATLARRFATWLLAGQPGKDGLAVPSDHPVRRRVEANTHADLLLVGRAFDEKKNRQRAEIVVEDTRRIAEFLRLTPAEGGWRIVVLDEAEHMNRAAANALLKVLEEPPPRTVMLLASSVPGRLLPTVRSRCRLLRLDALGPVEMERALEAALPELPLEERAVLAGLADGSPGRAVSLAGAQVGALGAFVSELMARDAPDPLRDEAMVDAVLRNENGFEAFLELLCGAISGRVRERARSGMRDGGDPTATWSAIRRLRTETDRFNLEKRQALLSGLALLNDFHPAR
ncbi:DNA polymerase III subunit delta' [Acetobacteraceae bacterium KSS8]|uniref:DNA polymerase III subunit delta n=1 Tax=Endosaccharibacter trunci TaxID=2812733 RepID=A0ABT1W725_9PROT|nr:DNA polymerase III subunit delta' [Acetobacteraceae bacterium KSS8]